MPAWLLWSHLLLFLPSCSAGHKNILHLGPSDSTSTARSACLMQTERFIYPLDTQIWEISLRQRCISTSVYFGVLAVYCSTLPAPHSLLLAPCAKSMAFTLNPVHILSANKWKRCCFALPQVVVRSPGTSWYAHSGLGEALQKGGALHPVLEKDLQRISKLKCRFWGSDWDLECGH